MIGFTYNPEAHAYFLDGQQIPGITRVLSDLGYSGRGAAFFTDRSRRRGQAVHTACQLADELCPESTDVSEVLDRVDLSENLIPYLEGYLLFKREIRFVPKRHEFPSFHRGLRIAGTPDKWGHIGSTTTLVDLKSWKSQGVKPKRSAVVQVVGYKLMIESCFQLLSERLIILKLPGNGRYRMYEVEKPALTEPVVWAAAGVWWDLHSNGLLPNENGDYDEDVAATEGDE